MPFCTGGLNLDFPFILLDGLAGLNLICRPLYPLGLLWHYCVPAAASREQLCVWILLPKVYSLLCLFQMLTKLLSPAYIPQVSKVVCILFLLPELLAILSKLEPLVNSKNKQLLPSFHPGHE